MRRGNENSYQKQTPTQILGCLPLVLPTRSETGQCVSVYLWGRVALEEKQIEADFVYQSE